MRFGAIPHTEALRLAIALLLSLAALPLLAGDGSNSPVVIYYPDIREPYRGIFMDIIDGIESELALETRNIALNKVALKKNQLPESLPAGNNPVVIALGKRGVNAAQRSSHPVVFGAVKLAPGQIPENFTGISLEPDPAVTFEILRRLAPAAKRIHVISRPQRHAWLLERAQQAAAQQTFELKRYTATNLNEVASHYRDIFRASADNEDVIWLLEAAFSRDKTIIANVLENAWKRNTLVISHNPAHVKRGVLLAFYPDNKAMGKQLGIIAKKKLAGESVSTITLLNELLLALNRRTADHLGLKFSKHEKFDLIHPPQ